ncbi:MAG: ribonuclease [Dorea sp.]|nr:ribonuclease [Dorea sp.]MDY2814758.1 ribonuclease domain-containing protein [Dorea sp.]
MRKKFRYIIGIVLLMLCLLTGCESQESLQEESSSDQSQVQQEMQVSVEESGEYTSKDEVAAYLNEFGHLPDNFITKKEAQALGWESKEGNLDEVAPGKSIGGDYFGNYEEVLPDAEGRTYHECDIDYEGGFRNAKRIVYSDDGLIYYTEDHYETFELLYGEE